MVFETELEREIELEKEKQKKKEEKRKRKSYNGKKVASCIIGIIIVFIVVAFFSYQYYKEWNLNQEIIKNNNQKIELAQIEKMKLWDETKENIRNNNKYIEISYNTYKVKLNSEKLESNNKFAIQINKQKSNYQEWENQDILEIDVSKVQPSDVLEQIELNTNELLEGLNKVDIYGIKAEDKKIEYIETKEIHEDNITLILREEYEKYVLVYVPVKEIKVEEEIEIFKDELYQMQLKIEPSNATTKMIHIEDLKEGSIIQVKENGVIQAVEVGTTEFEIEAEQGKVKKKVKVTVKEKAEEAPTESEKEQLVEKENETTTDMLQIQNDEEQVNATILDNYINGILIVNKTHSLPNNYDPGTNPEALQAYENMKAKANEEGVSLKIVSGYRSYQTQQSIYQRNVKLYGEESANTFSAKQRTIGTSNRTCF